MSNPWLKKNPLMSIWLSGAHRVANHARGHTTAHLKRQISSAQSKAAADLPSLWLAPVNVTKPRARRARLK